MPAATVRADLARDQLRLALAARRESLRHVIAAEMAIWAPLIHQRRADLADALADTKDAE